MAQLPPNQRVQIALDDGIPLPGEYEIRYRIEGHTVIGEIVELSGITEDDLWEWQEKKERGDLTPMPLDSVITIRG